MLGRRINALMSQRLLRLADIALGELRAHEAADVMQLDSLNLFRSSVLSSVLRHMQHPDYLLRACRWAGRHALCRYPKSVVAFPAAASRLNPSGRCAAGDGPKVAKPNISVT